tara:strand:+ start:394 stop:984 length:591 start_codon:yes stop_codon:yes gene_type:complete
MDSNLQLMLYLIPTIVGLLLVLPLGRSIVTPFSEKYTSLATERGRIFFGLIVTCIAGAAVSFQTLWISSKVSEGGNFCSSNTVFSCDDVIGNAEYNVDPILGLPWGGIGAATFCILLYLVYSSSKEPNADWVTLHLKLGTFVTFTGFFVIALLVYYEFQMEKICQYCTTAHLANVAAFIGFFRLVRMNDSNAWNES